MGIQIKEISSDSYSESYKREKRSKRVSLHLTTTRRDIMEFISFAESQTGQWRVHVRTVCVLLHQLLLGSITVVKLDWPSVSQLKNFDNIFFFLISFFFFFRAKVVVVVCFTVNFFLSWLFLFKFWLFILLQIGMTVLHNSSFLLVFI